MSSRRRNVGCDLPNFASELPSVGNCSELVAARAVRSSHDPQAKVCILGGNTHEENFAASASRWSRSTSAGLCQTALTEQQVEGVQTAIKALGCTVEDSDITAKGDGYKADDVECKDGQYDMMLDKDFKITEKEKED